VLHGELVRDSQVPGGGAPAPYGQMPTWAPSQLDQNSQPAVAGDGEATKRHQVETYLAALDPDQLRRLTTLGLAYLLKMLAAASGAAAIHLAPPATEPNRIVRHGDVLHGELVRDPQIPDGAPTPYGQMPTWAPSQLDQNGQPVVAGDGEATKRHQVETYLAALDPGRLRRLTTLGPRAAARELTGTLNGQGVQVSERYVQQILDDWTAAARHQANGRRRTR
jgi:hypothetical protein